MKALGRWLPPVLLVVALVAAWQIAASTGFLAASATTNETAYLTYKVVRSLGMVVFDNQARV